MAATAPEETATRAPALQPETLNPLVHGTVLQFGADGIHPTPTAGAPSLPDGLRPAASAL